MSRIDYLCLRVINSQRLRHFRSRYLKGHIMPAMHVNQVDVPDVAAQGRLR